MATGGQSINPPTIYMQTDKKRQDGELCDIKQQHLGSADGSNTQPQQETLIVRGTTKVTVYVEISNLVHVGGWLVEMVGGSP